MKIEKDGKQFMAVKGMNFNGFNAYLIIEQGGIKIDGAEFTAEPDGIVFVKPEESVEDELRKAGYVVDGISAYPAEEDEEMLAAAIRMTLAGNNE